MPRYDRYVSHCGTAVLLWAYNNVSAGSWSVSAVFMVHVWNVLLAGDDDDTVTDLDNMQVE